MGSIGASVTVLPSTSVWCRHLPPKQKSLTQKKGADDALISQCMSSVSNALGEHGAVAISHIARLASARERALRNVSRIASLARNLTRPCQSVSTRTRRCGEG